MELLDNVNKEIQISMYEEKLAELIWEQFVIEKKIKFLNSESEEKIALTDEKINFWKEQYAERCFDTDKLRIKKLDIINKCNEITD